MTITKGVVHKVRYAIFGHFDPLPGHRLSQISNPPKRMSQISDHPYSIIHKLYHLEQKQSRNFCHSQVSNTCNSMLAVCLANHLTITYHHYTVSPWPWACCHQFLKAPDALRTKAYWGSQIQITEYLSIWWCREAFSSSFTLHPNDLICRITMTLFNWSHVTRLRALSGVPKYDLAIVLSSNKNMRILWIVLHAY